MGLFLELYVGHLLGDFLFQPGRLVAAKREGVPGLLLHILIIAACTSLVMARQIVDFPREYLPLVVLISAMHLVIERITILAYLKTPTRGLYTFLLDQSMHVLSMALLIWLYNGQAVTSQTGARVATAFGVEMTVVQLAALAALLTVMLFGRILTFELGNAIVGGEGAKGHLLRWDLPRLLGTGERALALIAALAAPLIGAGLPGVVAGLLVPFVPRLVIAMRTKDDAERRLQFAEVIGGLGVCAAAWLSIVIAGLLSGATGAAGAIWWRPPLF